MLALNVDILLPPLQMEVKVVKVSLSIFVLNFVVADVYFSAKEFVLNNYRLTYVAALATLNFW